MLTFQQTIHKLTDYWEKKGCIIHHGHDLETGAGTFNPATFLRCLGPEPYKTAYVEPSRRPSDGRFGENPNRVQLFHQFQVIIKPSPMNILELYEESLQEIGLNLAEHDLRYVHDDWESPTLGAYGLGWEVWMDGMEVTQFTYFQGLASQELKPVSVEITYGLERLCMYVQNKDNFFDMQWNDNYTYGEIVKRNEVEWSAYNFNEASSEMWLRHFDDFEREAKALMAKNLPLPAYDFVVKASHAFNILDARGVISVTERTGYIGRIRDLARMIASSYLAMREKEGFPLLQKLPQEELLTPDVGSLPTNFAPEKTDTFLLEIGSEPLPATFVPIGMQNLENALRTLLKKHKLSFDKIEPFATPRRIGALIHGLSEGTESESTSRKGPALATAFAEDGSPTKQGAGFLKAVGAENATKGAIESGTFPQLTAKEGYLFATIEKEGQSVYDILAKELPNLILKIDFPKKMRWGTLDIEYPRPLRWITALYGTAIIPFAVGNVAASNQTFGHAQLDPNAISLDHASNYFDTLKEHKVLAKVEMRKESIEGQLAQIDGTPMEEKKVLAQVLHLSEWPMLTVGHFNPDFLKVPPEVLISEMVEHQKYFPLAEESGLLKNQFVITADNTPNDLIRKGNEKVLSARLADGTFLYEQDLKKPLESCNEMLGKMTFQKELGSMLDKVMRIAKIAQQLNDVLKLTDDAHLTRAALLCKSDLATGMVGEFPELQGTIGKYLAAAQSEPGEVATAIEEHWMPRFDGAPLPQTPSGILLSLADKLDNLTSYFAVGLKPTSSSDPYALRRQTIGLLKILIEHKLPLDLSSHLNKEVLTFVTSRAKGVFEEYGFAKDEIEASLKGLCTSPYDQFRKVEALHSFRTTDTFTQLFEVYKRAKGQLSKGEAGVFDPALATEPAEKELTGALHTLEKSWNNLLLQKKYEEAFQEMAKLQKPLAHLFDTVKILADDPAIQKNRLSLLHKVFDHFNELVDFSKIQAR